MVLGIDSEADGRALGELLEHEGVAANPPLLRRGARGEVVRDLQGRLRQLGHHAGLVDGVFGQATEASVRGFQRSRGLRADGVVGSATWSAVLAGSPRGASIAAADRWVLPSAVRAAGEAQFVAYDGAPAWQGQQGCAGGLTSGGAELLRYIQATFPGVTSVGGYNCRRNSATPSLTSVHGTGRALDVMIPELRGGRANAAVGDPIANWLVENASLIGVQYVIWNRTSWGGHRSPPKDRRYGGPNPHTDHIHLEITLRAAQRATPWFSARANSTFL